MSTLDKVYEAYCGKMGESFQNKTKERIEWILGHIGTGNTVLDIGCSQGIVSILAAEKGAAVLGLDIEAESIAYAEELLKNEYPQVKNNIQFIAKDFFEFESSDKYDIVLVTEVLEHLKDPQAFLNKVKANIVSDGKAIISVPFGINAHPDHYTTFFLGNFISLLSSEFQIEEICFMENWIGAVCTLSSETKFKLSDDLLYAYDGALYQRDQTYQETIKKLRENNATINDKYKQSLDNYITLKQWFSDKSEQNQKLLEEQQKLKEKYSATLQQISDKDTRYQTLQSEQQTLNEKYKQSLDNYATMKLWLSDKNEQNQKLLEEQQILRNKYDVTLQQLADKKTQCQKLQSEYEQLQRTYDIERAELQESMKQIYQDYDLTISILEEVNRKIQTLEVQNGYLKKENQEYRRKLSIITDSWWGKLGIRVYKKLKKWNIM